MTISELEKMLGYAEQMEKGIDPTTGISFSEDTVLNCIELKQYNAQVAYVLRHLLGCVKSQQDINAIEKTQKKLPFSMSPEQKERFEYCDDGLSISALVYKLNGFCEPYMRKLRATDIISRLQNEGYLETCQIQDGKEQKVATQKGKDLGIVNTIKTNQYGNEYMVNIYNINAQRFILQHFC